MTNDQINQNRRLTAQDNRTPTHGHGLFLIILRPFTPLSGEEVGEIENPKILYTPHKHDAHHNS